MSEKKYIVIVVLILVLSGSAFGRVQVSAQIDSSSDIYIGETFNYHIIIDGQDKPARVDLTLLSQYNPKLIRSTNASDKSIIIRNGKQTVKVVKRYVMSYSLNALRAGQLQLPAVKLILDGKTYRTNPVEVNILKPETTDKLDLEVTLSQQRCYVGQPIIMTINFYVSNSVRVDNFSFNIPAFNSDDFYIKEPDITGRQVREYRLHTGMRVLVSRHRVVHNGQDFILLTFSKVLIPKSPGQIQIEPTAVFANIAVAKQRPSSRSFFDGLMNSRYKYKRFQASSKSQTFTVLPLPEKDRPKDFYGLVGQYTISASAIPTTVNVGDPITLTIKIGGSRYLKPVQWPQLEQIPALAENFKIPSQRATPAIENGFKVFTQTIRANNDKITEIPPIQVAFFDPDKGNFVVAKTKPVELNVAPTTILTDKDFEGKDFAPMNKEVEAIKKGLSANYEGLDVLKNTSFSPLAAAVSGGYLAIWALPLTTLVLSSLIKFFTHTTAEKTALKRRRRARGKAVEQLKRIFSARAQHRQEQLVSIMKQYIGERFDKVAGSLTADDCHQVIAAAIKDDKTADRYRDIIAKYEEARYSSAQTDVDKAEIKKVIALINAIEKKSKK